MPKDSPQPRVRRRNITAIDLPAKITHLCTISRLSDEAFKNDISYKTKKEQIEHPQKAIDHRTLKACLDCDSSKTVERDTIYKLTIYFNKKLGINLDAIQCGFSHSRIEDFKASLTVIINERINVIQLPLADRLPNIGDDIKYLCGTYLIYRYSLSDRHIVTEVISVQDTRHSKTQLYVKIYASPVRSTKNVIIPDEFDGIMYRFGRMFYIITSFHKKSDRRMRILMFPIVKGGETIHYGMAIGHSAHADEPVSTVVVAEKINANPIVSEEDKMRVRRVTPTDSSAPQGVLEYLKDESGCSGLRLRTWRLPRIIH